MVLVENGREEYQLCWKCNWINTTLLVDRDEGIFIRFLVMRGVGHASPSSCHVPHPETTDKVGIGLKTNLPNWTPRLSSAAGRCHQSPALGFKLSYLMYGNRVHRFRREWHHGRNHEYHIDKKREWEKNRRITPNPYSLLQKSLGRQLL